MLPAAASAVGLGGLSRSQAIGTYCANWRTSPEVEEVLNPSAPCQF